MRPLIKQEEADAYYEEPDDNYLVRMRKYDSMTIEEIYDFFETYDWYAIENESPQNRTQDEQNALKKKKFLVNKKLGFYGEARYDLLEDIGFYCAYCGMPILDNSNAHVEHVKPKSWYPQKMLLWDNFLISCRDCNDRKSNNPTGQPGNKKSSFVWPDEDSVDTETITCSLVAYVRDNSFHEKNPATAFRTGVPLQELIQGINNQVVTIRIATVTQSPPSHRNEVNNEVLYTNTSQLFSVDRKIAVILHGSNQQAIDTIGRLLKLNQYKIGSDATDRRVVERTMSYVQAVDALNNALLYDDFWKRHEVSDAVWDALTKQIEDAAKATGFWSVWYHIFLIEGESYFDSKIYCDFHSFFSNDNNFPGTDDDLVYG